MTLRTLNYGNYGIFLTMSNAGFTSSNALDPKNSRTNLIKHILFPFGLLNSLGGGQTALMLASKSGHLEVAQLLLKAGADKDS